MDNKHTEAKLSRKEFFKQLRREANEKAKERRRTDPRQIALKDELKQRRRDAYREFKERRKAALADQKRMRQERRLDCRARARTKTDETLMRTVTPGNELEEPPVKRRSF